MKHLLPFLVALIASFAAAVPDSIPIVMPEGASHPRAFLTPKEVAAVRKRVAEQPWAAAIAKEIVAKADGLVAEKLDIPHCEGQWSHWYTCADDGTQLKAESPTRHVCRTCGKVYTGQPYDGVYVTERHRHWLEGIEDLGLAYALEPKPEYAQRVRDILTEYASFYGDLELHDIYGKKGTAKDRLFGQTLNTGVALCSVALGYDMVYDAPQFSADDREAIEKKLLRPMVDDIRANPRGISNWQTWHNAGVCAAGLVIGDREYVDWSVNGPNGILFQLNRGSVMPSGMWYEESPSYHWYAFEALAYQLESCRRAGMDFYEYPIVRGLFAAPVRQLLPNGDFVPLHDSVPDNIASRRQFYEIAFREYSDPLFAAIAEPRRHKWALFWGVDELPATDGIPRMASSNDASEGLAILRNSEDAVAMLDYGPGASAHVQHAKLNMLLYALGDIQFVDPGRLPYGNPMHAKWFRQTIAHNTVVVDEKSQAKAPGRLRAWMADGNFGVVRATCDGAYPGAVLDRTLLMNGNVVLDVFRCSADAERTFDMALHLQGHAEGLEPLEEAKPFGNQDGYGILMDVRALPDGPLHFAASADGGNVDVQTFDESDNYHAFGYGTCSMQEKLPAIIRRQKGRTAVFAAAYQVLNEGSEPVTAAWDAEKGELSVGDVRVRVSEAKTEYRVGDGEWQSAPEVADGAAGAKADEGTSRAKATTLHLDLGSEDVAPGYVQVDSTTAYTAERGHGWVGTPKLHDDIQDKPEALDSDFDRHRDFTWSYEPAEFRIDIAPDTYELAVTSGDFNIGGPATKFEVVGQKIEFPVLRPKVCEFVTTRAAFAVKQSPLVLRFSSEEKNNWQVNEIALVPAMAPKPASTDTVFVKFFEKAKPGEQVQPADRRVRVIAASYPLMDSLTLDGPSPIAELWAQYVEDLKKTETFERGVATRDDYRRVQAAVTPRIAGAAATLPKFDGIDDALLARFSPWGMYVAEDESVRSDLLARASLTRMVAEGHLDDRTAELADYLRRGAYTTLFLRMPTDTDPVCHAARAAIFEMYAMFAAARGQKNEVGMFKRAAHLANAAIAVDAIASADDAAIVSECLDVAWNYAAFTEAFPEQPAPEDVSYLAVMKPLAFTLPKTRALRAEPPDHFAPDAIRARMKQVYRYAMANPRQTQHHGWERAALHVGIMEAALATKDAEYLDESVRWSQAASYDVFMDRRGPRDADNQACAQVYLDLYLLQGGDEKIASIREVADAMIAEPRKGREAWWWCDALFMAPPVLAKLARATGEAKYAELLDGMWWDAKDFLYNSDERLFFRDHRYFEAKTENGKPVFWGRGNGWVLSGLARILTDLPKDDPRYGDYLAVYRDMAGKIASIQGADGMWRTSLADPAEFPMPEASCTAFFVHGIAWGINNGVLDRAEYEPVVRRGWRALDRVVYPTGKIGWVQHVAGAPGMVAPDMTREYAPGAFLLAGSEVLRMVEPKKEN